MKGKLGDKMEDWSEHVRRWEGELVKIDQKIQEANDSGMNGRKIYGRERENILSSLGNAQDLVRGR